MVLVGLELSVVAELHVHGPAADDRGRGGEHGDHAGRGALVGHLQEGLVLALKHQHVGDPSERYPEMHHVNLAGLVRDVPDVDHAGRLCYKWREAREID